MLLLAFAIPATANDRVDFRNDLIPVFTKNGCNAGACHGAAIGRGGFKLSLYGGDPASDHEAITQQLAGRRINLTNADQSLVVLKPAEHVEHGGGTVFDIESESAQLLIRWIQQGAELEATRELQSIEIEPKRHVARALGEPVKLKAIAKYSDGTSEDVTAWTIFKPEDASAVTIDKHQASVQRRGRHIVVARFLNKVVPIEMIVPLTDESIDLASEQRSNFIDDEVLGTLGTLGLPVSVQIDDATFVRRLTLDLTGRLPAHNAPSPLRERAGVRVKTPNNQNVSESLVDQSETAKQTERTNQRFDPSPQPSPLQGRGGKVRLDRGKLIDQLLASDEFNEYWTLQLAKLLRIRAGGGRGNVGGQDANGGQVYHSWVAKQLREQTSYADMARILITATGDTHTDGPPNFYRTAPNAAKQAEFVTELFMGSRLRCANCHNHPLDRWTQDDYHGLAAIFAKVDVTQVIKPRPIGEVIHPVTLEPAVQRIPGEQFLADDTTTGREEFAKWLTSKENPYFAKAIVNRLWKRMMGRGLVEPADDFRATNPATHPKLLDQLADDFVAHNYNLRRTLKLIASSRTYARSADATPQNKDDDRFYSHSLRRPLEPEVMADSIADVLGVSEIYGQNADGTRAIALVNPKTPSRTLDVLGRCGRDESCEGGAAPVGGLPQKLHMFNGPLLNDRIASDGGRLQTLLAAKKVPIEIVNEFYRVALNRMPTEQETHHWQQAIDDAKDKPAFLEDFVWGLLNSDEFLTNH
ncbi:MAG: DUF1553 domain-containing protein [Planctomycetaceae bacterium]